MKNDKASPELTIARLYHSKKLQTGLIVFALAGIALCIIVLLPPVQNMIFSFVKVHISQRGSKGTFENRLLPLLSLPLLGAIFFALFLCCVFSKTITEFLEDAKHEKAVSILSAGITVLALGYISFFSYTHGRQWLHGDLSSEMVLSRLLADENRFVTPHWHYSTEIRLIYQTIFTMPLFKALGALNNWALIRSLTVFLNNSILILSYVFMTRQLKLQTKWIFITALFLIMPVSTEYWERMTFGGYYIFFTAQLFLCLGLFFRLSKNTETVKPVSQNIDFMLFTALSLVLGIQGIRSLMNIQIPLMIASIAVYIPAIKGKKKFPLFLGIYSFIVCVFGFIINYLLHFKYNFHSFENMLTEDLYTNFATKLGQCLACLAGFFGLYPGNSLLSAQGIMGAAAVVLAVVLFVITLRLSRLLSHTNDAGENAAEKQFMPVFFITSVVFNIFVFVIADEPVTPRYFIPFMILYIPLFAMFFEYTEKNYTNLKRIAVIASIVLFILGQSFLNFQKMAGDDITSARKGYIQYLLDNRLDYGFATFENANATTELTNGRIGLAGLEPYGLNPDKKNFRIQGWLNPNKFFDPSYHPEESFLLLTLEEWSLARKTERPFSKMRPDYEDDDFIVIRYPSASIIYGEVLDN
ncbi:MAG: hypothetical protein LBT16_03890 [Treponema sp.]|jgi:hypothetical protein|nr:hypothetical protein [Treponema sp.]